VISIRSGSRINSNHIGVRDDMDIETVYLRRKCIKECLQNAIYRSATLNQGRGRRNVQPKIELRSCKHLSRQCDHGMNRGRMCEGWRCMLLRISFNLLHPYVFPLLIDTGYSVRLQGLRSSLDRVRDIIPSSAFLTAA
jgi:hypothetical protein